MGHTSLVLAAVTAEGPPFSSDTLEHKSWLFSGKGLVAKGDIFESLELRDMVLSDGETKLDVR